MRCREAVAIATFHALKALGGEWEKMADEATEQELCRIANRIRRSRESGQPMSLAEIVRKAR